MRTKSDIAYSSDVIRDTAKELGISEEKVEHVLEFAIYYIKKLTLLPNIFSIYLPEIGQIYLSAAYLKNAIVNLKAKKELTPGEEIKLEAVQRKLELMESLIPTGYSPHKKRSKIRNNYFSLGKSLQGLEAIQNGYNEKSD